VRVGSTRTGASGWYLCFPSRRSHHLIVRQPRGSRASHGAVGKESPLDVLKALDPRSRRR
jgi:hypothetical protein